QVAAWQRAHKQSSLIAVSLGESLWIQDTRPLAGQRGYLFVGVERWILEATHLVASESSIARYVNEKLDQTVDRTLLAAALRRLLDLRLLIQEGSNYLSLAVPMKLEELTGLELERFLTLRKQIATSEPISRELLPEYYLEPRRHPPQVEW